MLTFQRIVCLKSMVEAPYVPCIGCMALIARISERILVNIILGMTTDTVVVGRSQLIVQMAGLAGNQLMHADQGERGKLMIKPGHRCPVAGDVAGLAQSHLWIGVLVIGGVT